MKHVISRSFLMTWSLIVGLQAAETAPAPVVAAVSEPAPLANKLGLTFSPLVPTANLPAVGATPSPPAGAVILPKFEVRSAPLNLSAEDVQSGSALLAAAKARYLNSVYQKTGGQLMAVLELLTNPLGGWHPNDATAMTLYAQDARLRRIKESNELIDLYKDSDLAKHRELRELLFDTNKHGPDRTPSALRRR